MTDPACCSTPVFDKPACMTAPPLWGNQSLSKPLCFSFDMGTLYPCRVPTIDGDKELSIRPGTQATDRLRMRGYGVPHLQQPGRGDQYVHVEVSQPASPYACAHQQWCNCMKQTAKQRAHKHMQVGLVVCCMLMLLGVGLTAYLLAQLL